MNDYQVGDSAKTIKSKKLKRRRSKILASTGLDETTLNDRAELWLLTPEQRSAWETIQSIDFLLRG